MSKGQPASWATTSADPQNPAAQKGPILEDECFEGNIAKFLNILFLNLCFVSEVQWDHGAHTGGLEPMFLPPTLVLSDLHSVPCNPPGLSLPTTAGDTLLPSARGSNRTALAESW